MDKLPEVVNHGGTDLKQKISGYKAAGIKIQPIIWDTIYMYLADYLSVINITCADYLQRNLPMPIDEGKKVQSYNRKAMSILETTLFPIKDKEYDNQFANIRQESIKLRKEAPGLVDDISHYVSNGLHKMGFILDDILDPKFPVEISVENTKKLFDICNQVISAMEYIRKGLQGKDIGF